MNILQALHFRAVSATSSKNQLLLSSRCEIRYSLLSIRGRLTLVACHNSLWFADYSWPIWISLRFFDFLLFVIFQIGVVPCGGTAAWILKSLSACQTSLWFEFLRLLNIHCVWIHYLQIILHKNGRIFSTMALDFQVLCYVMFLQIRRRWRLFTVVSLTDGALG